MNSTNLILTTHMPAPMAAPNEHPARAIVGRTGGKNLRDISDAAEAKVCVLWQVRAPVVSECMRVMIRARCWL